MLAVDPYTSHVGSRLLDFFGSSTPWQRGLWVIGTVLGFEEILETADANSNGVLSDPMWKLALDAFRAAMGDDAALSSSERHAINDCLGSPPRRGGVAHKKLSLLSENVRTNYLHRWSGILRDKERRPKAERTARAIASHLLDAGYSPRYLHHWWQYRIHHESGTRSLADLVGEAASLDGLPRLHTVLVVFRRAPGSKDGRPSQWLDPERVVEWLRERRHEVAGLRQVGGLLVPVQAADQWAAVDRAAEIVQALEARFAIGSSALLEPVEKAWVDGKSGEFQFAKGRRVEVHALARENQLYRVDRPVSAIDSALELLAPLINAPPGPAVAAGWAAVEALLTGPGDGQQRIRAAERLATLVACSFPRAELTRLAWTHQKTGGDDLARELSSCTTNLARARVLAAALREGRSRRQPANESDIAAFARMGQLLENAEAVLGEVRSHVAHCFRRFYRQRNLVLHAGRTEGLILKATLRTIAPLVGAGVDRIAHAWFVEDIGPLELAARAEVRLALLGGDGDPLGLL